MALIERNFLISKLSPPFNHLLSTQLVDEFISMERRYIQRDWEPAELDGGQFAEIVGRILFHLDTGILDYLKSHGECANQINGVKVTHLLDTQKLKDAQHIIKVTQTVYKFRSDRGAVHISHNYTPNHMDSKFLMEAVRWCMNELLRIFMKANREEVAKTIREVLQFDVPCIGKFGDKILIQRTDLKPEEEVLILLHYAGERGFTRTSVGKGLLLSAPMVTKALQKLVAKDCRQIVLQEDGHYVLTDLGHRRIRNELAQKLLVM